ncbi:hypothetical protein F5I97DRAFT_1832578 [Phlebopus sp. FC_14]|nr:hypothetical protein F5I97DRAFT_1832578 [Phlebopus sp. FC_14]
MVGRSIDRSLRVRVRELSAVLACTRVIDRTRTPQKVSRLHGVCRSVQEVTVPSMPDESTERDVFDPQTMYWRTAFQINPTLFLIISKGQGLKQKAMWYRQEVAIPNELTSLIHRLNSRMMETFFSPSSSANIAIYFMDTVENSGEKDLYQNVNVSTSPGVFVFLFISFEGFLVHSGRFKLRERQLGFGVLAGPSLVLIDCTINTNHPPFNTYSSWYTLILNIYWVARIHMTASIGPSALFRQSFRSFMCQQMAINGPYAAAAHAGILDVHSVVVPHARPSTRSVGPKEAHIRFRFFQGHLVLRCGGAQVGFCRSSRSKSNSYHLSQPHTYLGADMPGPKDQKTGRRPEPDSHPRCPPSSAIICMSAVPPFGHNDRKRISYAATRVKDNRFGATLGVHKVEALPRVSRLQTDGTD